MVKLKAMGTNHLVVSHLATKGVGYLVDQALPDPENEWLADLLTIGASLVPVVYYYDREHRETTDSRFDTVLPLGNFIYTAVTRLSEEQ